MFDNSKTRILVGLLAIGTMLVTPAATALNVGVDASGVSEMKNAGATPAYAQIWAGKWNSASGWSEFEAQLRLARDQGATPVIMWYYWGDSISENTVKYGKDGKSRTQWDSMAKDMARRAQSIMGSREFFVVLEPEFNKNGVQYWESFDGYLADQAWSIRGNAPSAKIVVGFGHWGGWSTFDRAMAASHLSGFQYLRGSTRDSSSSAENTVDLMLRVTKDLRARFGKDVLMFDLSVSTYGGWEGVQERAIQRIAARSGELESAGLRGFIWRDVKDDSHSSGYYGSAEAYWGVMHKWGGKKPAFDDLVGIMRGGSSTTSTVVSTASSTTTTSTSTSSGSTFSSVSGNEWWIQAKVAGSPNSVATRVNGGSWIDMPKQWWGAHAVSTRAPSGSTVELRATYGDGSISSATYRWPDATPLASGATAAGQFDAQFSNVKGNEWWLQADVTGNEAVSKVEARINGGSWHTMTKQWWGAYAVSKHAPAGSQVEIRATSTSGATDATTVTWLR